MFEFNRDSNIKLTRFVQAIEGNEEMLVHLSHLANCQYKWLDRLHTYPDPSGLDWWHPVYSPEELEGHFQESTSRWIQYLSGKEEEALDTFIPFIGADDKPWEARIKDIALQLIFHSFHHRAQIQRMVREAGVKPKFIDYIGARARKKEADPGG